MVSTTRRYDAWSLFLRGRSVFSVGAATRIYLAPGATDMRKSFDGLYGLVRDQLLCDPLSGHLFLFSNAKRNRLKIIFFDGTGLWVCSKRIERGRVHWPVVDHEQRKVVLSQEQFTMLLGGIDLAQTRERKWFRKPIQDESSESRKTA
jgi:transposase